MQAYNIKTYQGHVIGQDGKEAIVLCVAYSLDQAAQNHAAFFGNVGSDFPPLTMPTGRPLTFREELRITRKAACIFDAGVPRENDVSFLSAKLTDAYGPVLQHIAVVPNQ